MAEQKLTETNDRYNFAVASHKSLSIPGEIVSWFKPKELLEFIPFLA